MPGRACLYWRGRTIICLGNTSYTFTGLFLTSVFKTISAKRELSARAHIRTRERRAGDSSLRRGFPIPIHLFLYHERLARRVTALTQTGRHAHKFRARASPRHGIYGVLCQPCARSLPICRYNLSRELARVLYAVRITSLCADARRLTPRSQLRRLRADARNANKYATYQ